MAKSDYAQLMISSSGKPTNKIFKGFCGTEVELYKNFIYLNNTALWNALNSVSGYNPFISPVVSQLTSDNDIVIGSLHIKTATLTNQHGIMIYVHSSKMETVKLPNGTSENKFYYKRFAGIATSGYKDKTKLIHEAVDQKYPELNFLKNITNPEYENDFHMCYTWNEDGKSVIKFSLPEKLYPEYSSVDILQDDKFEHEWIGVSQESVNQFKQFLNKNIECGDEKWLKKIQWDSLNYLNQGDKFILESLGQTPTPQYVGEIQQPLIFSLM